MLAIESEISSWIMGQITEQDLTIFIHEYIKEKTKSVGIVMTPGQQKELNKAVIKDYFEN